MANTFNTAMVFAAGRGTRMQPLTDTTPKPLVEVAGKPIIAYALDKLAEADIEKVVVNTHHLAEPLEAFLKNYQGLDITILREDPLLETGGGLVNALPYLDDSQPLYVINGDIIWQDDVVSALERLAESWQEDMNALLLLKEKEKAIGYDGPGDFELLPNGQLKKSPLEDYPYVYTGVQLFHPRLLQGRKAEPFSLSEIYLNAIQEDYSLQNMFGLVHDGMWLHIGTAEAVQEAERHLIAHIL